MNPHYLTFFRMIRTGRYFHVGTRPTRKSYGYVGNTVHQYLKLLEAAPGRLHGRLLYLADYKAIAIEEWADAFQRALGAPPIRTLPVWLAKVGARVGDVINSLGWTRFPFNSFRLNNVVTPFELDLSATAELCGPLPFTMMQGVAETVRWLQDKLLDE